MGGTPQRWTISPASIKGVFNKANDSSVYLCTTQRPVHHYSVVNRYDPNKVFNVKFGKVALGEIPIDFALKDGKITGPTLA